ncbi:uncharacterized protein EI97DRAFT_471743 [Westerdykella ornata]|uniref:dolichol kinase n=1 Tax=Westerdykella ornata TaxID=318751 RepID=A0A6A6JYB2_WESOR|nr:uncharacterized protein EI97DRAFT_471743 [Westerdykella ornata]KAF2280736.1 hypothetical protein EI97DRAFT_471743 [Westerdykella ornata]
MHMSDDTGPSSTLASSEIEHLELFRRSPHPYHRHQHRSSPSGPPSSKSSIDNSLRTTPVAISDEDGRRRRRRISQSPSASGTEADDEAYAFVKALPAPPLRPRKGLRDVRGAGVEGPSMSPLLTPSQVDEEGKKYGVEYFRRRRGKGSVGEETATLDEEARKARERYIKRRRNELLRRTTETGLLVCIAVLTVRGCGCWRQLWERWYRELLTYACVIAGLLGLYPLRLLIYSKRRGPNTQLLQRPWIRIPSAFDPATILYPPIIPVLISISLYPSMEKILLPNIILGLAALPSRLIPFARSGDNYTYSSLHWLLSILPLFVSENTALVSKVHATTPYKLKLPGPEKGLHPEVLATLFALHHALLPPLHYLTTTSLLPAELQLLSIGLINLLLFAESPQAIILRTIVWVGGLGLFILCGKVLSWNVALARIPRWRFRRAGQMIRNRQSFLTALTKGLKRRSRSAGSASRDSDADDDEDEFPGVGINSSFKKTQDLTLNMLIGGRGGNGLVDKEIKSAIEPKRPAFAEPANDVEGTTPPRRRNTLPTLPSQDNVTAPSRSLQHRRRRGKWVAQSFLALTPRQAVLRKWGYAAYFYAVVIFLTLGPIRYLMAHQALDGQDPFGWAIGYLFGNTPSFRFFVFNHNLQSWIPLPPLPDGPVPPNPLLTRLNRYLLPSSLHLSPGPASTRLLLTLYLLIVLIAGLTLVLSLPFLSATIPFFPTPDVDTRRKTFHFTMVALLLPTLYIDPLFLHLALALVLALFILADLARAAMVAGIGQRIARFLTPFVDGRDLRGPVVVSHFFLLVGCAVPVWLGLAGVERDVSAGPWRGWDLVSMTGETGVKEGSGGRDVSLVAGVVCVGMGDAAASLVGRRWGRRKWPWAGGKSLEGSAAFAGAVMLGLVVGKVWLRVGGWEDTHRGISEWSGVLLKSLLCALGASLNEAVLTGGNDNVIVPILLWILVRGVGL